MTKAGMIFSSAAIAVVIGAVAVTMANGSFTALLSSIGASPSVDRAQTPTISAAPVQQPEVNQSGAIEPLPAPPPAQLPAPAAPAPVDTASVAKTAPALDQTGSIPAEQANRPLTAAEILLLEAKRGSTLRTPLTVAEKAGVERGLKQLDIRAATPQNRFALTPAEQASVERGLRELKNAEKAKQVSQR
jgi:hypothetical protein